MLCMPEQLFNSAHSDESKGLFSDQVNLLTGTGFQHVLYFIYLKLDKSTYSCNILPTWSNTLHKNAD